MQYLQALESDIFENCNLSLSTKRPSVHGYEYLERIYSNYDKNYFVYFGRSNTLV